MRHTEWMGGRGTEHIKHAQTGVFDVFEGGCRVGEAGVVGLGHEWMGGRGAEHVEHAQMGVFDVFGVSRIQPSPSNTSNMSVLTCLTCLASTPLFSSCSSSPTCNSQPLPSFSLPFPF